LIENEKCLKDNVLNTIHPADCFAGVSRPGDRGAEPGVIFWNKMLKGRGGTDEIIYI